MKANNFSFLIALSFLLLPFSAYGFFSPSVNRAMDKTKECNKTQSNHAYFECMSRNNYQLKLSINKTVEQSTKDYPKYKKNKIKSYVKNKKLNITKTCMNEQSKLGGSMNSDRRHIYCAYEHLLELQINLERNIDFYAK